MWCQSRPGITTREGGSNPKLPRRAIYEKKKKKKRIKKKTRALRREDDAAAGRLAAARRRVRLAILMYIDFFGALRRNTRLQWLSSAFQASSALQCIQNYSECTELHAFPLESVF